MRISILYNTSEIGHICNISHSRLTTLCWLWQCIANWQSRQIEIWYIFIYIFFLYLINVVVNTYLSLAVHRETHVFRNRIWSTINSIDTFKIPKYIIYFLGIALLLSYRYQSRSTIIGAYVLQLSINHIYIYIIYNILCYTNQKHILHIKHTHFVEYEQVCISITA